MRFELPAVHVLGSLSEVLTVLMCLRWS